MAAGGKRSKAQRKQDVKRRKQEQGEKEAPEAAAAPAASPSGANLPFPVDGDACLAWLLHPITPEEFFRDYWEQKPLHIQRKKPGYYGSLFNYKVIEGALQSPGLKFARNINIARFEGDEGKVMYNKEDDAKADLKYVKEKLADGCSVQCMHPQQFSTEVRSLVSTLEQFFGCLIGANSYYTPGEQQGFAPHYDDVEVFMLQVEGSKKWKLFKPPEDEGKPGELAYEYSRDFEEDELEEQIWEGELSVGDLLYFPRGTVHCGVAVGDTASHHLTVSAYQRCCWADYIERLLPRAVALARDEDVDFRQGLPVNYFRYMGAVHEEMEEKDDDKSEDESELGDIPQKEDVALQRVEKHRLRAYFKREFERRMGKLIDMAVDLDGQADDAAAEFITFRLPPVEKAEKAKLKEDDIPPTLEIRWKDPEAIRVTIDQTETGMSIEVMHSFNNARETHMDGSDTTQVGKIEMEESVLKALVALCTARKEFFKVKDLPELDRAGQVALVKKLAAEGLLEMRK
mmetsp:Transcript_49908/g.108973  ORF Transcript_49908/g.108973 Transcript_49908/m.108973 type:complete len:514 (+) Transcript_49908:45-1586(+)